MREYNLIWYGAIDIFHSTRGSYTHLFENKPGFKYTRYLIQFFASQISMMDRTESIKMPINSTILPFLKLPEFKKVTTNFEELCEKRARYLLDKAISTNRKLTIVIQATEINNIKKQNNCPIRQKSTKLTTVQSHRNQQN